MGYLLFVMGSIFEYSGMFILLFTLFRFTLEKRLIISVIFIAILMSQVSYFTRLDPAVGDYSTYIQFVLFVIVLWRLFNVPLFHSLVMNFTGILAVATQGLIILIMSAISGESFEAIASNHVSGAIVQVITCLAHLALAKLIHDRDWGFHFVPMSGRSNVQIKGTNAVLLAIISLCLVTIAMMAVLFRENYNNYILYTFLVFIFTIPLFLYFSIRKDNEDAG